MGVGTSDGQHFDDAAQFELAQVQTPKDMAMPDEQRDDQNHPFKWGMGESMEDLGSKPDKVYDQEPKPKDVHVIRHGSTDMNSDEKVRGWSNVPLNEDGVKESWKVADKLKDSGIQVLFHSDLDRASDTAQEIAKRTGAELVPMKDFRSWHAGDLTGKPYSEATPIMKDHATNKPDEPLPGGESFNEFKDRVNLGVAKAEAYANGREAGIVTHRGVERLLNAQAVGSEEQPHLPTFFAEGEDTGSHQKMPLFNQQSDADWLLAKAKEGRIRENVQRLSAQRGNLSAGDLAANFVGGPTGGGEKALFLGMMGAKNLLGEENLTRMLAKAERGLSKGASPLSIKVSTGLEKGPEGMWRKEITDDAIKTNLSPITEPMPDVMKNNPNVDEALSKAEGYAPLSSFLDHPDLFRAYPEIKDVNVIISKYLDSRGSMQTLTGNRGQIVINPKYVKTADDFKDVLLHEIQHWIQFKEGLPMNVPEQFKPDLWDKIKGSAIRGYFKDKIFNEPQEGDTELAQRILNAAEHRAYQHQSSEQESFNVGNRMKMTPLERKFSLGESTEDISRDRQVFRRGYHKDLGPIEFGETSTQQSVRAQMEKDLQ